MRSGLESAIAFVAGTPCQRSARVNSLNLEAFDARSVAVDELDGYTSRRVSIQSNQLSMVIDMKVE